MSIEVAPTYSVQFWVPGKPIPQGSMKSFVRQTPSGVPFAVTTHAKGELLASYRADIAVAARNAGVAPRGGAVSINASFTFVRPKSHYGTGRNASQLKPSAPDFKLSAPDVEKLARSVSDSLEGVAFYNDSQVVAWSACKRWGHEFKTTITITYLEDTE